MIRRALIVFLLSVLAVGAIAQQTPVQEAISAEQRADILKAIGELIDTRVYATGVDLKKWPEYLSKHQAEIDKAETIRAFTNEVNRTFREFGISHLRLRSPSAAQSRRTGPVATGFGMQVEKQDAGLIVRSVTPDSPAAKAGIEVGDTIVELDGKAPAVELLGGEAGSKASIKVLKKDGTTLSLELQRQQFSTARKETLKWIDDETAVLRVFTFSRGYGRDIIEGHVKEANEKGAKYLVLDLRSNGGGATDNLRHLLSLFLPPDSVIGSFVNRTDAQKYTEATKLEPNDPIKIAEWLDRKYKTRAGRVEPFKGKLAVLTNRGSASASEICAAALREVAGATVVGTRTAGAVLASVYGRLPHGFELQYPVTDYVTAKGMRLEGNPLMPDIEVSTPASSEKDEAVERAVAALKAKALGLFYWY